MRLPVVDAWNFTIERQLTSSTVFSIGYVGNKGYHVTPGGTNYNVNQPSIVGFGTLSTNQRRYFYQLYGWTQSIKYFSDDGSVKFNSLQVRGEKRFTSGLQLQGNFTWDSAFDFSNTYFFWNPAVDYGRENNVRLFVFNFNGFYELPFGKNKRFLQIRVAPGGPVCRRLADIGLAHGIGYSVHALLCELRQRRRYRPVPPQPGGQCEYLQSDRGRLVPDRTVRHHRRRLPGHRHGDAAAQRQRLHARALEPPGSRTFGNVARNSFFAAFLQHRRVSQQQVPVHERVQGQFRAEMFNTFNHVNLGQPNAQVHSPTAGQIFAIASLSQMRKWQFGLRVQF